MITRYSLSAHLYSDVDGNYAELAEVEDQDYGEHVRWDDVKDLAEKNDRLEEANQKLREAAEAMLALEARRMFEHDAELTKPTPCMCPGCKSLRKALGKK